MTNAQKEFIDGLNISDLHILESILREDSAEFSDYISTLLKSDSTYDPLELAKDIPMSYLPVFGIKIIDTSYPFSSVYDYYQANDLKKSRIPALGPKKIANLDYATDFLLQCLSHRIKVCHSTSHTVLSGVEFLDDHLEEKEDLVLGQVGDIYQFLRENGDSYVFCTDKRSLSSERLLSSEKQRKMIELLARFSEVEDLKSHRIESFQKFIKK